MRLQFSYPSLSTLKLEVVYMSKGTTGMMTYLLLKYSIGKLAVPLRMTSTYLRGYLTLELVMNSGNLWL